MKKSTKIITIGLVSSVLLASLILILVYFLPRLQRDEKELSMKESLESLVVDYYENELIKLMPDYLDSMGYLKVTLDSLQGMNKNIKLFEDNSCDYDETYVELTKDEESEKGYKTEVVLKCEYR